MSDRDFLEVVRGLLADAYERCLTVRTGDSERDAQEVEIARIADDCLEAIVRRANKIPSADRAQALIDALTVSLRIGFDTVKVAVKVQRDTAERQGRISPN